jgi:hypothetical protein
MSDDSFAPQIETIPERVRQGVAQALGVSIPYLRRLHGGTTLSVFRFLRSANAKKKHKRRCSTAANDRILATV